MSMEVMKSALNLYEETARADENEVQGSIADRLFLSRWVAENHSDMSAQKLWVEYKAQVLECES